MLEFEVSAKRLARRAKAQRNDVPATNPCPIWLSRSDFGEMIKRSGNVLPPMVVTVTVP